MGLQSCPVNLKFGVVLFSVFIASCASQGELREETAEPRLENLVEVQPAPSSRPLKAEEEKVLLELTLPQTELVPKKPRDKGPRFSLSAEDVDVKTILFSISKEIDQNIMIDPAIFQKVTLNLKEVTLKEMLDHVLLPLNLMYEVDENFIRVISLEMQTRIFRLNYLISKRESLGNMQASLGFGTYEVPQKGVRGSAKIISSEETDLWQEIALGLQKMVASERPSETLDTSLLRGQSALESAWFSVNKQAGVLVVKAYPEVLLKVAEFLEEVEGSVQRQVLIRARVIKVALKDEFPRGIDWNQLTSLNTSELKAGPAPDSRGYLHGNQEERVDEMLEALALQGDVSVLASPQIAALNNQRAVIRVGTEDTIFVPNTVHSIAEGEAAYISRPITLGVVLDVVPQINVNGNVIMSVHTNVTKKAGERVSPDGLNRVPVVDIRESNNVVMARNGQTVVIGGLLGRTKELREDSQTALERVPIIGEMFHEDLTTYEKSELLILLTPQIMVGDAIDDRLRIEEKRLKRFGATRQPHKMKTSLERK